MGLYTQDVDLTELSRKIVIALQNEITVEKLVLFGSRVQGTYREDSDFDIAVISPQLSGMNILRKIDLLSRVALAVDCRLELKGYGSSEFNKPLAGSMMQFIKQQGKVIYSQ